MPNLLDKLNTLVKASLNNFIDETTGKLSPVNRAPHLGNNIDGEIAALRKQIDSAISEEDAMKQRIETMAQEIARTDQQIDEALKRNDEPNARQLSTQMQRQQRQSSILQADLEEHRRSTSDLMQHVNTLEAMVADARHRQQADAEAAPPAEDAASDQAPNASLSNLLRDARERVENMLPAAPPVHHIPIQIHTDEDSDTPAADAAVDTEMGAAVDAAPTNAESAEIDTDLAKRRSRLSKPDQPEKKTKPD